MGDLSDEEIKELEAVIVPEVRDVYAEEEAIVAAKIAANTNRGSSWLQEALTWVPYIDEVFSEDTGGPQAAVSDVNLYARGSIVINKIEAKLGYALDEETRTGIREDVADIWGLGPGTSALSSGGQ